MHENGVCRMGMCADPRVCDAQLPTTSCETSRMLYTSGPGGWAGWTSKEPSVVSRIYDVAEAGRRVEIDGVAGAEQLAGRRHRDEAERCSPRHRALNLLPQRRCPPAGARLAQRLLRAADLRHRESRSSRNDQELRDRGRRGGLRSVPVRDELRPAAPRLLAVRKMIENAVRALRS